MKTYNLQVIYKDNKSGDTFTVNSAGIERAVLDGKAKTYVDESEAGTIVLARVFFSVVIPKPAPAPLPAPKK